MPAMTDAPPGILRMVNPGPMLRGLALVWQSAPGLSVLHTLLLVVQGVLPLAALYITKLIVDAVVSAGTGATSGGATFTRVIWLIVAGAGVAVLAIALRSLSTFVSEAQALRLSDHVHDVLHAKSVEIDLEFYENAAQQDRLYRAQHEAPFRPARIVSEVAQVIQNGLGLLAVCGLLVAFHWLVAVVLFVAAVPGVLVKLRHSRRLYGWAVASTPTERNARYVNALLIDAEFAKEVRLFGLGDVLRTRFRQLRQSVREEKLRLIRRRSLQETASQSAGILAVFGAFTLVAFRAWTGSITIGDMVMYFGAFQRGQDFLKELLGGFAGIYEDNLFLQDLDAFLAMKPVLAEPSAPRSFPRPVRQGIVLDHVRFRYPGGSRDVLEDISCEIRAGEHIALVGENGSGKTTLVKLLCRLYDPTGGGIRVDGIDLREFAKSDLRRGIGVVFQDFVRFNLTVRDNIWFGDVSLAPTDERILAAARRSGADDVVRRLPGQYDAMLGRQFAKGHELSLGEWQKIALARSMVKESGLIILDEPTASLDPRSEALLFEQFHEIMKGRTAILISHRFSAVRMADRILVLDGGRIVEVGAHDDLMGRGGRYAELFELQARHYR